MWLPDPAIVQADLPNPNFHSQTEIAPRPAEYMGQIRIQFPEHMQIDKALPASIHVIGLDGIPMPCRILREGLVISISRNRDESGHVYLAWPTDKWGDLVLVTGTLPESDTPIRVAIELARGSANRLRNQISNWQEGGLIIPDGVNEMSGNASSLLAKAVLESSGSAAELAAIRANELAVHAIFELCRAFAEQVLPLRLQNQSAPRVWLGCRIDEGDSRAIESLKIFDVLESDSNNLPAGLAGKARILGPLMDASPGGLDDELQSISQFEDRRVRILDRAREKLTAGGANARIIHAVAGLNGIGHRMLSYPQQLQLSLDMLQLVDECSIQTPVMISFDNPWGERLARSVGGNHPMLIADSLLRRGVRISMLGLEINLDFSHRGSLARDPLQWLDLLDMWGQLGLPMLLLLRIPYGVMADENSVRPGMQDSQRLDLLKTVLPLILSRPAVHGVIWQQVQDKPDSRFPGGGLLDLTGKRKPVWDFLEEMHNSMTRSVADQTA